MNTSTTNAIARELRLREQWHNETRPDRVRKAQALVRLAMSIR